MNNERHDFNLDDYADGLDFGSIDIAVDENGMPMIDARDGHGMLPWGTLDEAAPVEDSPVIDDEDTDEPARDLPDTSPRTVWPTTKNRLVLALRVAGKHVGRSPWYVMRALGRIQNRTHRWVTRADDAELLDAEVKAATTLTARRQIRTVYVRGVVLRGIIAALPLVLVWTWINIGQWGIVPLAAIIITYVSLHVTGWRIIEQATPNPDGSTPNPATAKAGRKRVPLSRPFVTEALAMAGFGEVKTPSGRMEGPVITSASPVRGGERMVIDLPRGVSASKLMGKTEELAGALGRPLECIVITPQPKVHPGRFELFVANKTMDERGATKWAGAKAKRRSFFDPVPVGVDLQGKEVTVPLFEVHGLIGGGTGMGKSYTARLLLMAAACDPTVTLLIHNLKGGGDYRGFAPVAHSLHSGGSKADMQALADDLAWVQSEIGRRGRILENLPSKDVPEGKLTPDVAQREGMGPIFMLVDEAQRGFAHSLLGDTIRERFEDVVRTGRAVGVKLQQVTQGTKEGSIPSSILDQSGHRIGHGVTNISDANLILGSDAHGRGYRAVDIDTPGVAYVGMSGGTMTKTLLAKVDLPEVEKIMQRAAQMRKEAGRLTGMAAGHIAPDTHDGGPQTFLKDVLAVWPSNGGTPAPNALSADLAELLGISNDDEYGDLTGADVSRRMTDAGVKVSSQRIGPEVSGRGVRHEHVVAASMT